MTNDSKEKLNMWGYLLASQNQVAELAKEQDRKKADDTVVILYVLIGFCIVMFGILFMMALEGFELFLGIGVIFVGLVFFTRAAQRRAIESLFKRYAIVIANNPDASVVDLAASMKVSSDEVRRNFQMFSKRGLMIDVVIDEQSGRLIYGNGFTSSSAVQDYQPQHSIDLVEVECRGCGAKKMVKAGGKTTCDHCGSELLG